VTFGKARNRWLAVAAGVASLAVLAAGCGGSTNGAGKEQAATRVSQRLILDANTVTGAAGIPKSEAAQRVCVLSSRFTPGQEVVWQVRVYDPATGKLMDDKALQSVAVLLPDGKTLAAKYGGHPANDSTDYFWATGWEIPKAYPTGSLQYTVKAAAHDGRTGEFTQFNVASALLTIVPKG
jgi:hypothetical protein